MSTQDAIMVAKKFVRLVGEKYPIEKAYLFGSFAKNKADEASDIDVCIVSPAFGTDHWEKESELRKLSLEVDYRLSPVAFGPEDIKDRWSQLAHEITTHGIKLQI